MISDSKAFKLYSQRPLSWVQEDDFNGEESLFITTYDFEVTNINNYDTMTWESRSVLIDRRSKNISPSFICTYKFNRYSV